jgi:hypothetical protein
MTIMNMLVCDLNCEVRQDMLAAMDTHYSTLNRQLICLQHSLHITLIPYRPALHASNSAQSSLALLLS